MTVAKLQATKLCGHIYRSARLWESSLGKKAQPTLYVATYNGGRLLETFLALVCIELSACIGSQSMGCTEIAKQPSDTTQCHRALNGQNVVYAEELLANFHATLMLTTTILE